MNSSRSSPFWLIVTPDLVAAIAPVARLRYFGRVRELRTGPRRLVAGQWPQFGSSRRPSGHRDIRRVPSFESPPCPMSGRFHYGAYPPTISRFARFFPPLCFRSQVHVPPSGWKYLCSIPGILDFLGLPGAQQGQVRTTRLWQPSLIYSHTTGLHLA